MNMTALSDEELNLMFARMIYENGCAASSYEEIQSPHGYRVLPYFDYVWVDFLDDWEAMGPLMIENEITLKPMNDSSWPDFWNAFNNKAVGISRYNENPLRAIVECIIMIKQAEAEGLK